MDKIIITKRSFEELNKELEHYKKEKRYQVIEAIKDARTMSGEMSENVEYHDALAEQDKIENHISVLEDKINNAHVIDISKIAPTNKVVFGCTVTFLDLDKNEELVVQIVGIDEADFKYKKISYLSPIAKEALGKEIDDIIDVITPSGDRELEIKNIEIIDR